jgi:CBS domain-containing protein
VEESRIRKILEFMEIRNIEYAVLITNGSFSGIVELRNLIKAESVGEVVKEPITFSPSDSLEAALMEMKERKEFSGVVVDEGRPVGVLLSNEILTRLL